MSEERKRDSGRFVRDAEVEDARGSAASRARNRTVLLTPETVGQVRASLGDEESADPLNELLPPVGGGWEYPAEQPGPQVVGRGGFGDEAAAESAEDARPQFEGRGRGGFSRPQSGGFGALRTREAPAPQSRMGKTPTASEKRPIPSGFEEDRAPVRTARARNKSKIVGFLISFDTDEFGDVYELRVGRWLVTSRATEHGDYLLIDDETISPMHAVIRATAEGRVQVLDQLSEHGSSVSRLGSSVDEEISGTTIFVNHGDTVRFGQRRFVVCLVPQESVEESDAPEES